MDTAASAIEAAALFICLEKGKVHKRRRGFRTKHTIASGLDLLYNVYIRAECVYSTSYRRASAKLKEDKTVRLTVRQCGDLS